MCLQWFESMAFEKQKRALSSSHSYNKKKFVSAQAQERYMKLVLHKGLVPKQGLQNNQLVCLAIHDNIRN